MVACNEPSEKEYTEQICAAIPSPIGGKIAEFEKARLFMSKCYKVTTNISADRRESGIFTKMFGTGASPNLI